MAIDITCAGCKTRFQVSDKFAGKQGPCPKCKAIITVPAKKDEVVIHAPEMSGPKDSKGQLVLKPIFRQEARISSLQIGAIVGSVVFTLVLALLLRLAFGQAIKDVQPPPKPKANTRPTVNNPTVANPGTPPTTTAAPATTRQKEKQPTLPGGLQVILILGAIVLAPATSLAGYTFLRNDEMEPYRGRALWTRLAICGFVFPAIWGIYSLIFVYLGITPPLLIVAILVPILIALGGFTSQSVFDLEFGTGALHFSMYLATTVLLRLIIGLPPHWQTW